MIGDLYEVDDVEIDEDVDSSSIWRTVSTPKREELDEPIPFPKFTTTVDRALRDGRSDEVWDHVNYLYLTEPVNIYFFIPVFFSSTVSVFFFQMIQQLFCFFTSEHPGLLRGNNDFRKLGQELLERYPSIRRAGKHGWSVMTRQLSGRLRTHR